MKPSPNRFKDAGRGVSSDMSPEAVVKRIRVLDQLWVTAKTLRKNAGRSSQVVR